MTLQISRRGREYLETAQTLVRSAQTMTDRAIAGQLKALAEDYSAAPRRLRTTMRPRSWRTRPLQLSRLTPSPRGADQPRGVIRHLSAHAVAADYRCCAQSAVYNFRLITTI